MSNALARAVSILGHPVVMLPLVALAVALARGERRTVAWVAIGFALLGALVMAYSWWQVRRRRWAHVDASRREERSVLNRFLLPILAATAALVFALGGPKPMVMGLTLSASIVLVALLASRWCKLSLHIAFATFAAVLLWKLGWAWMLAALAFVAILAWSRLALQRHAPRDIVAGAAVGAVTGVAFLQWFAHAAY